MMGFLIMLSSAQTLAATAGDDSLALQDDAEEGTVYTYNLVLVGHPTLTRITLWLGEEVPQVDVVVEELGRPAGAAEPPLLVRTYLSIESSGEVENAAIQFRVSRDWLEQNNVDENTVKLLRLNSEWQELPTTLIRESDLYLYYEATSPGFSMFAVAGQSAGVPAPLALYAVLSIVAVGGGFVAFYWFRTRPMKPFVSLGRLKRVIVGRKPKREGASEPEVAETIRRLRRATKLKRVAEPTVEGFERPGVVKGRKDTRDIELLKRLKRKMEREK